MNITNFVDPTGLTIEGDAYVPLRARWSAPLTGPPLHYRLDGNRAGHLDLKVDRQTARLLSLVVINLPPVADRPYVMRVESRQPGDPVVDLTPWDVRPDGSAGRQVIKEVAELVRWLDSDRAYVAIAGDRDVQAVSSSDEFDLLLTPTGGFIGITLKGRRASQWREAFAWI